MASYTKESLRTLFQSNFNLKDWYLFLQNFFIASELKSTPERIIANSNDEGYYLGNIETSDSYRIGLFQYNIEHGSVANKRVGLRNLVKSFINPNWGEFDAALVVFDSGDHWRLSFICDIKGEATSPKRHTYVFGNGNNYYNTPVSRFLMLQRQGITFKSLMEAFSVEALTKQFYKDLFEWYQWAVSDEASITFPNKTSTPDDDRENIDVKIIRMITRIMFVWFIKQKDLVPDALFDENKLSSILKDFAPNSKTQGNYYNAILQNLFFATLNKAVIDEEGKKRGFAKIDGDKDLKTLYRYSELFSISEEQVIDLFAKVPFLNGGLFECLDKTKRFDGVNNSYYDDGFSRNAQKAPNGNFKYRAFVPNELFFKKEKGLFSILNRYNFTIEENTPNEQQVALDPELLGRVFENLLGTYNPETRETARNQSGSFYTPREIVNYMVDESLKAYLGNSELVQSLFTDDFKKELYPREEYKNIADKLKQIKIIDPACGSGAFPMGLLIRMVDILQKIQPEESTYKLKLFIIENCLYGCDIQSIASQITKLRFFISLICDCEKDPSKDNLGIPTLPNLETKFVSADSLLSLKAEDNNQLNLDDEILTELRQQLKEIRHQHFHAKTASEKKCLRKEDEKKRQEIISRLTHLSITPDDDKIYANERRIAELETERLQYVHENWVDETSQERQMDLLGFESVDVNHSLFKKDLHQEKRKEIDKSIAECRKIIAWEQTKNSQQKGLAEKLEKLTSWNPYDQNAVSSFFDPEWMFGVNDGFDIVIGNPPYIQLQNNNGELSERYKHCGFQTFKKTGDIYSLFYERGWQLLKENGHLCYITSNKWMRAGYGDKTRAFFTQRANPLLLIDFAGIKIFESATVDTNILLFEKSSYSSQTTCAVVNNQNKDSVVNNLSDFVQQEHILCRFSNDESWVILSPIEQSIKRKIEAAGTPLKDWDIQINYGIKTGFNDAFIISTKKRNEILSNCKDADERKRTEELIRPILRGRDIKRYGYDWAGLWLIATFPSRHYNIEDYPAVKAYLLSIGKERLEQTGKSYVINGEKVKARKKTNNKWFETQDSIGYWEDFSKPKIFYADITQELNFCLCNETIFCNNTTYFITNKEKEFPKHLIKVLNSKLINWYYKTLSVQLGKNAIRMFSIYVLDIPIPKNIKTDNIYEMYGLSLEEVSFIENM